MVKKRVVVANWKMNPATEKEATTLFSAVIKASSKSPRIDVVVSPPFVYLPTLSSKLKKNRAVYLGAQDVFWEQKGAFTGEISSSQIKDVGAKFVIVGHSERRAMGETNEEVGKKVSAVLKAGLTVIFCVGERARDGGGDYLSFIKSELITGLSDVTRVSIERVIIAYEPLWAIGERAIAPALPQDVLEMSIFIRKILADRFGEMAAKRIAILYGGSVDSNDARGFLIEGKADGLLVGRASLDPKIFSSLISIVDASR